MSKCDLQIEFDRKDRKYSSGETVTGRVYIRVNESVKSTGITSTHQWQTDNIIVQWIGWCHEDDLAIQQLYLSIRLRRKHTRVDHCIELRDRESGG